MESKNFKTIELPNKEIYAYREAGDRSHRSILFVHPHCYSSRCWEFYFPDLQDKFHLVAVDLRGSGFSTYNKPISTMQDFSDDLKLFCDAIDLKKFTLVGWSMGGMVAMAFTATYPSYVEKLFLVNSMGIKGNPVYRINLQLKATQERIETIEEARTHPLVSMGEKIITDRNYGGAYDLCTKVVFSGTFKPSKEVRDTYIDDYFMRKGHLELIFATNIFNISKESNGVTEGTGEVENIKCPTLIIAGKKDVVAPAEHSQEIKDALGDIAELKIYDDVGHAFVEEKRSEFITLLTDFVKKD